VKSESGSFKVTLCVLAVLLFGLVSGCGGSTKSPVGSAPVIEVKSSAMVDDYIRDIGTADQKYKNKNVKITGNVLLKSQFNNSSNFYIITDRKAVGGKRYSVLVEYPVDKVDEVNKLKYNDFVVAEGLCVGVVPQKDPTDVSIQIKVGQKASADTATASAPAPTPAPATPAPVATSGNGNVGANEALTTINGFEDRLHKFADRINGGQEDKNALRAVGNVLKEDITNERNKLAQDTTPYGTKLRQLYNIQWHRADCMVRGLMGYTNAFSEGGGYYDEFQDKFAQFKKDNNL
jgi:hypothetical protein